MQKEPSRHAEGAQVPHGHRQTLRGEQNQITHKAIGTASIGLTLLELWFRRAFEAYKIG